MVKKGMEKLNDLIEEAKLRSVWWILCIFAASYFLTHASKSMLMNVPVAILLVSGLRILFNEVEFRWKVRNTRPLSYLSHLERKQLSMNDYHLMVLPPVQKWKRKIDSPVIESAIKNFINKLLHDFVIDLWYSDITSDKDVPQLMHEIIMEVLGEVSGRIKAANLVDLLARDVVDLIGNHLDLFRRNQVAVGVDVMRMSSSDERDERLKQYLLASKELHPALISSECEYKVLQLLMGGLLAVVLRQKEAQCPLVRCIARELLTCLVVQPIMEFASPGYINELIEYIHLAYNNEDVATDQSPNVEVHSHYPSETEDHCQSSEFNVYKNISTVTEGTELSLSHNDKRRVLKSNATENLVYSEMQYEPMNPQSADWTNIFEEATPENMSTRGRKYKKKLPKRAVSPHQAPEVTGSMDTTLPRKKLFSDIPLQIPEAPIGMEDKAYKKPPIKPQQHIQPANFRFAASGRLQDLKEEITIIEGCTSSELERTSAIVSIENKRKFKRSNSTSDLKVHSELEDTVTSIGTASVISEYYSADSKKHNIHSSKSISDMVLRGERLHVPKLKCRIIGAYFEQPRSKSFAVYSIAVTDADHISWFVKRRYRNFERLHRHLKDIPNYTLHLPPKRIFSSSTEDSFVHQRCILLDKYLQDLLSIANVAEQHEVWDFLSASSKNYSFGKSSSAMRTLAVNVDDAVDDMARQFKGVSDGLMQKVVGPPSSCHEPSSSFTSRNLPRQSTSESINSFSDDEEGDKDVAHKRRGVESTSLANACHAYNDLNSQEFPHRVVKLGECINHMESEEIHSLRVESEPSGVGRHQESSLAFVSAPLDDPTGIPPEWTPPKLSVPALNLVDKIFQLNRSGWLRRQVFWISKQILQLVMEDAIDDWVARQIQWLYREDVIAQGVRWVQDVLWPDGIFFLKLRGQGLLDDSQSNQGSPLSAMEQNGRRVTEPGFSEQQLEAARRARDVENIILNGAPTALVSLIGHEHYRCCARDVYYFLQSTICLKQLGYGILELVLLSLFPELGDIVKDVHEKIHVQPVSN